MHETPHDHTQGEIGIRHTQLSQAEGSASRSFAAPAEAAPRSRSRTPNELRAHTRTRNTGTATRTSTANRLSQRSELPRLAVRWHGLTDVNLATRPIPAHSSTLYTFTSRGLSPALFLRAKTMDLDA